MSAIPIKDLLNYINQARTNPKKFNEYIKKELDSFINEKSLPLKPNCTYSTHEGKSCWKQAYQYMKSFKPTNPLQLNEGLNLAAMDHAMDMKTNNFFDHLSSNGMSFSQRIERRCGQTNGCMSQNLGTQFNIQGRNHALQTIIGLIIDDGVPNRGHRTNILSQKYQYCGIYAVKKGQQIETCIKLHSENVKVVNSSKQALTAKVINKPKQQQKMNFNGNFKSNFDDDFNKKFANMKFQHDDFNDNNDKCKMTSNSKTSSSSNSSNQKQKYVTSKSTSTKTSTVNGKTTKVSTINIVYSDGTTSEQVNEQTY